MDRHPSQLRRDASSAGQIAPIFGMEWTLADRDTARRRVDRLTTEGLTQTSRGNGTMERGRPPCTLRHTDEPLDGLASRCTARPGLDPDRLDGRGRRRPARHLSPDLRPPLHRLRASHGGCWQGSSISPKSGWSTSSFSARRTRSPSATFRSSWGCSSLPTDVVLACVVGGTLGLLIHRRPAPIKLAFNAALFLVGSSRAVVVFHRLAPTQPGPADRLGAAFLATIAVTLLGLLTVNAAIWLAQGRSDRRRIGSVARFGLSSRSPTPARADLDHPGFSENVATGWWPSPSPSSRLVALIPRSHRGARAAREPGASLRHDLDPARQWRPRRRHRGPADAGASHLPR